MSLLLPFLPSKRECALLALFAYGATQYLFKCSQPAQMAALIFTASVAHHICLKAIQAFVDQSKAIAGEKKNNLRNVLLISKGVLVTWIAQKGFNFVQPRGFSYIQAWGLLGVTNALVITTENMIQYLTPDSTANQKGTR